MFYNYIFFSEKHALQRRNVDPPRMIKGCSVIDSHGWRHARNSCGQCSWCAGLHVPKDVSSNWLPTSGAQHLCNFPRVYGQFVDSHRNRTSRQPKLGNQLARRSSNLVVVCCVSWCRCIIPTCVHTVFFLMDRCTVTITQCWPTTPVQNLTPPWYVIRHRCRRRRRRRCRRRRRHRHRR